MAARDRVADGEDHQTARLAALKEFGNVTLTSEAARRVWRGRVAEYAGDLMQDVRYGVRLLARSPGYAAVVVTVLAVGIGANAAVFTIFKGLALKPLSGVSRSAELGVVVSATRGGRTVSLSYPEYRYLRDHHRAFSGLVGASMRPFNLGFGARGERVWGELVTGNFFQVLGARAALGRTLLPSDEIAPGRHQVAVIGHGLWRRVFGSDPAIVGKTIVINAYPLTVVGVAEPEFQGSVVSLVMEVFIPVMMQPQLQPPGRLDERRATWLQVYRPRRRRGRASRPPGRKPRCCRSSSGRGTGAGASPAGDRAADVAVSVRRANLHAAGDRAPPGHGRVAPADRLRQRGQPRARPRGEPPRRDRDAPRARGRQGRVLRLLFIENLVVDDSGRRGGIVARAPAVAARGQQCDRKRSHACLPRRFDGSTRHRFRDAAGVCERDPLRLRAGAAELTRRSRVHHERRSFAAGRPAGTAGRSAGRLAGRGVACCC